MLLKRVNFQLEQSKGVLKIAWPLIIANAFWNLQVTIDRIYLGQFSSDSLGAAIAAIGVYWVPMALLQQTAAYVSTFVAQYSGAKEEQMIGPSLWQSIYISIIGGLLFLLLIPVTPYIFKLFGHTAALQELEVEYFKSLCWSALPNALVAAASGFFTGIEKSGVIMRINAVGMILNIVLDYCMIFGHWGFPRMGIAGAGYATALAGAGAAIYGLYLIFNQANDERYAVLRSKKWHPELMRRFMRFGFPSGMQWALEGLAFTVFLIYVGRMPDGNVALAASGITVSIMLLSILPALGVAQAVGVLVGRHLGENRPDLAEEASWVGVKLALFYIILVGISFLLFPNFYTNWFRNAENAELWQKISEMVPYLLMFVALFTMFDSMNIVFSFALKGAGDTRYVTMVALTMPWPLMVLPTAIVSGMQTGIYWAWAAASFYIILQAIVFLKRFNGGKWKSMRVIA